MKPRTCSRCNARLDSAAVLTIALHVTPDGSIVASPAHVCAACMAREAAEEIRARQNRHAPPPPVIPNVTA